MTDQEAEMLDEAGEYAYEIIQRLKDTEQAHPNDPIHQMLCDLTGEELADAELELFSLLQGAYQDGAARAKGQQDFEIRTQP